MRCLPLTRPGGPSPRLPLDPPRDVGSLYLVGEEGEVPDDPRGLGSHIHSGGSGTVRSQRRVAKPLVELGVPAGEGVSGMSGAEPLDGHVRFAR